MLRREFGGGGTDRQDRDVRAAVTVVIADDHPAILDAVGRYLELNGIAVLGTTADGDGAVALCEELRPAVALVDLRMPGLSGLGVLSGSGCAYPTRSCSSTRVSVTARS